MWYHFFILAKTVKTVIKGPLGITPARFSEVGIYPQLLLFLSKQRKDV